MELPAQASPKTSGALYTGAAGGPDRRGAAAHQLEKHEIPASKPVRAGSGPVLLPIDGIDRTLGHQPQVSHRPLYAL